jgi:trehalose 6-phosphate synthase
MSATHDLLVLSNRGPLSFTRAPDGTVVAKRGGGGLVVTVGPGVERDGACWVSAAVGEDDAEAARQGVMDAEGFHIQPVVIDSDDYRAYYDVVANQTVWFCLHGLWDLPRRPRFDRHWWAAWDRFRAVNQAFASVAASSAAPGATVLVQDYHLALVPALLAAARPDLRTATFVHTPWCSPGELAVLPEPVSTALLAGLAGGGACGFHSERWADVFVACCEERLGRTPSTFVSPAATDIADLRRVADSEACAEEGRRLEELIGDRRLIVRVDRIELSKNVLRGFWAFDELLESRPDLRGQVVFAAMVYPSRLGLAEYLAYGHEVQALVGQINAKWAGAAGGEPIVLDSEDNYPRSVAALRRSDVLLVNPIRDGLNLVAKEGPLVNDRDGVVVLSHHAGAWDAMSGHAIGINPWDVTGTAGALATALDLPADERASRAAALRKVAEARSPLDWFDDQKAAARVPGA